MSLKFRFKISVIIDSSAAKQLPCGALSDDDFSDDDDDEATAKAFLESQNDKSKQGYRKEVRPSQEALDKLPLRPGQNEIEFTVTRLVFLYLYF